MRSGSRWQDLPRHTHIMWSATDVRRHWQQVCAVHEALGNYASIFFVMNYTQYTRHFLDTISTGLYTSTLKFPPHTAHMPKMFTGAIYPRKIYSQQSVSLFREHQSQLQVSSISIKAWSFAVAASTVSCRCSDVSGSVTSFLGSTSPNNSVA